MKKNENALRKGPLVRQRQLPKCKKCIKKGMHRKKLNDKIFLKEAILNSMV